MPQEEALRERLEEAIERIRGVTSARVLLDERNEIVEIHLVGSPARKPKQIVRDTESLLYAHFGIRVDYRKISLVQLSLEQVPEPRTRLQFLVAEPHPRGGDCVQVVLQDQTDRYEGIAPVEHCDQAIDVPAAAQATLDAVQKVVGPIVQLALHEAQTIAIDSRQVCLVVVSASTGQTEEWLTGTCIVGNNAFEAAAKATLDAINRRLPVWTMKHQPGTDTRAAGSFAYR